MNYERSLDEIIMLNKSKNQNKKKKPKPVAQKRFRQLKPKKNENKLSRPGIKKSNVTSFKSKSPKRRDRKLAVPDARMKISRISDARVRILNNRNRIMNTKNKSPLMAAKSNIADARLKIEAHKRQKFPKPKPQPRNSNFGITRFAADGILERKINVNSRNDNGVHVEYEDDDMNLEYETLRKEEWNEKTLLVRRTVQNNQRRNAYKSPMHDDRMYYENNRARSPSPYNEPNDNLSYKDLTRTIPNAGYRKPPGNPIRRTFPKRSSPVRQYSYDDDDHEMRSSRLSPVSHQSPLTRNSSYHLLVISNLHENVTGEDIKELFEDVGDLVYAKMTKSGVAEVAYKSQNDAMKAVEIYHNRQLDGLPMKCTLVSQQQETSSSRYRQHETSSRYHQKESSSSRYIPPVNTLTPVEPDSRIIKKALFSSR